MLWATESTICFTKENDVDWLYLIICLELAFFLLLAGSLLYLYLFYKEKNKNAENAFQCLVKAGYLKDDDYALYNSLAFWGFGFKVSILNMLLKGKRFKVKEGRYLDTTARECLLKHCNDDFAWVKSFYNIFKMQALFVVLFIVCIILSKKMGV